MPVKSNKNLFGWFILLENVKNETYQNLTFRYYPFDSLCKLYICLHVWSVVFDMYIFLYVHELLRTH